jgi:hypothetical protein
MPVKALNNAVFPQLGFPAKATVKARAVPCRGEGGSVSQQAMGSMFRVKRDAEWDVDEEAARR